MDYYKHSELSLLKDGDVVFFKTKEGIKKYPVDKYDLGYFLRLNDSNNLIRILTYLKIIDVKNFTKKYKCGIYNNQYNVIISKTLEDLTSIVKELMIISETLYGL